MLTEYLDIKRTLKIDLVVGAVIGVVLVGLLVFLFVAPAEIIDGSYVEYMLAQGHTEAEAASAAAVFIAIFGPVAFLYGLFLPLGYTALKRMKNRLLEGWIVSCLLMIFIQLFFLMIVAAFGSIVGLVYLIYSIARMALLKRRMKKSGESC
ncbi:MAG: hypothetical protein Q4B69_06130 [Slackia sp.]|nr:hypothetical protein [Slackia sp.]